MKILKINNITIPDVDIKSLSSTDENIEFNGSALIASKLDITLINDGSEYDERIYGSMFHQVNYINWEVSVYDDDIQMTIWQGRLKEYSLEDKSRTVKITSSDYVRDIVDTNCIAVYSGITPAEVIYKILTNPTGLNIPSSKIVLGGFEEAKAIQANQTITTNYIASDNVKCIDVIRTLCQYCNCLLYTVNNLIIMYQDRMYTGELGTPVGEEDVLPGSYKQWGDDSGLINDYSVAYKSGVAVARALGADGASREKYGRISSFVLPESGNDSGLASDLKIIFETSAGAHQAGSLAIDLFKDRLVLCSMTLDRHMNFVQLNDVLNLKFRPFVNEPIRVRKIKRDDKTNTLTVEGVLLNYYRYMSLDVTPPDPVQLLGVINSNGSVYITWSLPTEQDVAGYRIYFTRSEGQWSSEEAGNFISPKSVSASAVSVVGGNCRYRLTGLKNNYQYYLRVAVYDTSFNESEPSNILLGHPYDDKASLLENLYCSDGDIFLSVYLAIGNPRIGYLVSGFTHYDDISYSGGLYGATAVYESPLIRGSAAIIAVSCDEPGDIMIQHRGYANGSFGPWSEPQTILGLVRIESSTAEFQVRVVFNSPNWSDDDMVYIEATE